MINFDSLSLKALINEIKPILIQGRVDKIRQPSRNELLIILRTPGKNRKLYICVDPQFPHIAILSEKGEELRDLRMPDNPPMFCMLLRKHMEGCKIKAIDQPGFDRILEIQFDSYTEVGEKVPMVLAFEFMGKHSNIIFYNAESRIILGCAHTVSSEKSREREILGGVPYIYPPKQEKKDILNISETEFLKMSKIILCPVDFWLNENFGFISRALASEISSVCKINPIKDEITEVSTDKLVCVFNLVKETMSLKNLSPGISIDKLFYSLICQDKTVEWEKVDSVNEMIDLYFGWHLFTERFSRIRKSLLTVVKKQIRKQNDILSKHEKTLYSDEKREKYRQCADIIMSNLYKLKPGEEFAELENIYEDGSPVKIILDPGLSPIDNAKKYYKLYKKSSSAAKHSEILLIKIKEEILYLESIKESLNQAESFKDLDEIKKELEEQNLIKVEKTFSSIKKAIKEKVELLEFVSSDNYTILAGKNNNQNEFLLKNSSPEDLWLHALNIPGSHVIIKAPNDGYIPETTLHEAVYISAWHSQAKNSSNVSVVYTRRKFVKKPSGAKPGFVIFSHEKTLVVNPDEARVLKLRKNK